MSPAKRSVANAFSERDFSDFIEDVPNLTSVLVGDITVVVYDNAIRAVKVVRGFDLMNRCSKLPTLDPKLIAHVVGWIGALVPNDRTQTH